MERKKRAALAGPALSKSKRGQRSVYLQLPLPACPPASQARCPRLSRRCYMMQESVIFVPAGSPITPDPIPRQGRLGHVSRSKGFGIQ